MHVFAYSAARLEIIRGGPEERRRFLDRGVASIQAGYIDRLARYLTYKSLGNWSETCDLGFDQHQELISTEAANDVRWTRGAGQALCHGSEHGIACGVAELIIDRLKAIEIEDGYRQGSFSNGEKLVKLGEDGWSVDQPCQ